MTEPIAPTAPSALVGPTLPEMLVALNGLASAAPEPSAGLGELLRDEQLLRAASAQPVSFRPALWWHDDEPAIWPRTVNLVQGQTGVHKSRVAELFGSAVLAALAGRPDLAATLGIGFRPEPGERYRLLYIDTERNLSDQFPYALQQLKARAGYAVAEHPPEFYYTSLVRAPRAERFPRLAEYLAYYRRGFDGHLLVILDVLSDCVADYNDVAASLGLMDLLNVAVNEQDATFLAVIHENPGSTAKARGHLGTEAGNKASTVLQVSLVKEQGRLTGLVQLLYLKRRYAAPGLTYYASFDETTKGLVRADEMGLEVVVSRDTRFQPKATHTQLSTVLIEALAAGPVHSAALVDAMIEQLEVSKRAAHQYLSGLFSQRGGLLSDEFGRSYWLVKKELGRKVIYSLSGGAENENSD